MLYLHLSKWLESKFRSAAQSLVFLYRVVGFVVWSYMNLQVEEGYILGRAFKSEFDHVVEVIRKILNGMELLEGAYGDQKDVIYESLPERGCSDEGFPDGFFVTAHEAVGIWWGSLGFHDCAGNLGKMPVHE